MTPNYDPYHYWLGIMPDGRPMDHYRLLGLRVGESDPVLIVHAAQSRFDHLQRQRSLTTAAWLDPLLAEISAACACLQDPYAKAEYDRRWAPVVVTQSPAPLPSPVVAFARTLPPPLPTQNPATVTSVTAPVQPPAIAGDATPSISTVGSYQRRPDKSLTYLLIGGVAAAAIAWTVFEANSQPRPDKNHKQVAESEPLPEMSSRTEEVRPANVNLRGRADEEPEAEFPRSPSRTQERSTPRSSNFSPNHSFEDTVAHVKRAVVRIETPKGLGSGVVIDADGIVATNFHVMEGARQGKAIFADGTKLSIDGFVFVSQECDLCLLQVETKGQQLLALKVAGELPPQGRTVFTFGNPKGLQFTVTKGVVSAVTTTKELDLVGKSRGLTLGYSGNATWVQTDASIDHGNSGGPLLGEDGCIYGLNTFGVPLINNAFFANTGPAILEGFANRTPVRPLSSLPGRPPSLPIPDADPSEDDRPAVAILPEKLSKEVREHIAAGELAPISKIMIEYREKALLDAKIMRSNLARDLQKTLADLETGKRSLVEAIQSNLLGIGGEDFGIYLLLLREIDQTIERERKVEAIADKIALLLNGPGDEMTKVTAACILHRIHIRDSSRTKIRELLTYLTTHEKNYASEKMLAWYLEHFSQPISPLQATVLRDIQIEQDRNRNQTGSQLNLIAAAQKRVKDYNEILGGKLYEQGMVNWRFRCLPNPKGLEMSLTVGTTRLILPNDYGLTEPCDVLMTAKVVDRKQVLGVDPNLRVFLRLTADDLKDVVLQRILTIDRENKQAVCLPLAKDTSATP